MLDLTGGNLVAYLRRIIEDAVNRSPRFRRSLGEVTHQFNNMIQFQDAQVTIKDVSASGNRLSPDFFMFKAYGRAILAKVQDHEGQFIEWLREIEATRNTPVPGVYYLNVDSVDDATSDVGLTIQTYRWAEGHVSNAEGSIVYLAKGIDGTTLGAALVSSPPLSPPVSVLSTAVGTGDPPPANADILLFPDFLYLLTPTPAGLQLYQGSPAVALIPLLDYWYQVAMDQVVVQSTIGGSEIANVLAPTVEVMTSPPTTINTLISFTLTDQTGYELQPGKDYTYYAAKGWVKLSDWTPAGQTITAQMVVKGDPTFVAGTNSENILQLGVGPTESLAEGQVIIHTSQGDLTAPVLDLDGSTTLPNLLLPGQWCRWEVRINVGQARKTGKKYRTNEELIPGLRVAIGDNVIVGDQVAIIVSPTNTETYEVYGSKENITFTVEVRSNDLQTSSDISEILKRELLVMRRENMEADGVTIFEASRSYRGLQRDMSGTAPQYTYVVGVTAMCDWKVYVPLVTRLAHLEITETTALPSLPRPTLSLSPRATAFGMNGFIESYS